MKWQLVYCYPRSSTRKIDVDLQTRILSCRLAGAKPPITTSPPCELFLLY